MKAIILENDYAMPERMKIFLDNNPDLFEKVRLEVGCNKRPPDDVFGTIMWVGATAILIDSTFMHTDQIEQMLDVFYHQIPDGAPFQFYISSASDYMNEWLHNKSHYFSDHAKLREQLLSLTERFEVFDAPHSSFEEEKGPIQVVYSTEHNIFHRVTDDPQQTYNEFTERH